MNIRSREKTPKFKFFTRIEIIDNPKVKIKKIKFFLYPAVNSKGYFAKKVGNTNCALKLIFVCEKIITTNNKSVATKIFPKEIIKIANGRVIKKFSKTRIIR